MKDFKLYWLIFLCNISINSFAQDLIINGSFTDLNICTEMNSPCAPSAWRTSISNMSDYKYFPKIEYAFFQVTDPIHPDIRSYMASRLGDTLIPGEKYHFSMDICPNGVAVNSIGILLTDSLIFTRFNSVINSKPCIEFKDNVNLLYNKKGDWLHLEKYFIAKNKSYYIIIGNFTPTDSLKTLNVKIFNKSFKRNFNFADNVSLVSVNNLHKTSDIEQVKKILYTRKNRHPGLDLHIDENTSPKRKTNIVLLHNDLLFSFNSFEPSPYLIEKVDSIILDIKNPVDSIIVYGYTDNIGSYKHNNELSHRRAETVAKYIMEKGILPKSKIIFIGKGSNFPIATNETENGRYQNRRVEILVIDK